MFMGLLFKITGIDLNIITFKSLVVALIFGVTIILVTLTQKSKDVTKTLPNASIQRTVIFREKRAKHGIKVREEFSDYFLRVTSFTALLRAHGVRNSASVLRRPPNGTHVSWAATNHDHELVNSKRS